MKQFVTLKRGKYDGNRVDIQLGATKVFNNTLYQLKSKYIFSIKYFHILCCVFIKTFSIHLLILSR